MDDEKILDLYFARSEKAISETELKYGRQVWRVSNGILKNTADADECTSDTWLRAWNAIPPARPRAFLAWLMRVARNLSLDRLRRAKALKRGATALALDELREVALALPDTTDSAIIRDTLNQFLEGQSKTNRIIFVRRYWFLDSMNTIAEHNGKSEAAVRSTLKRMRKALKSNLEKEGVAL